MSIHPEILDLIHSAIDGVATEAEQVRLREEIARDAAVRDEYRRLQGLAALLTRVEPEEPPAHLVPSVLRAIRSRRLKVRSWWPSGPVALRYSYALAAGAVIGALGLHLATGGGIFLPAIPEGDAGATIGVPVGPQRLDLTRAGIQGFATLKTSQFGTAIGFNVKTAEPVEFVVRYDPTEEGGRVYVSVVRDGESTEAGSLRLSPKK